MTLNARWQDSIHGVELVEEVELEPSTFLSILSRTSSDSSPKTKTFARIPQRFHISEQPASYVVQPLAARGHETLKINDVAMSFRKISQRLSRKLERKHFPNLSGERKTEHEAKSATSQLPFNRNYFFHPAVGMVLSRQPGRKKI